MKFRWRKYSIHFLLAFILLILLSLKVEKKTDYGLRRVERLWLGSHALFPQLSAPMALEDEASLLDVSAEDLQSTSYVMESYLNQLEKKNRLSVARLWIIYDGEYYRYFVGWELIVSFFFALLFASFFFFREKGQFTLEFIENQKIRHHNLNEELEARIEESQMIIAKMNKLQSRLVETEKLASIGRLSATLAHEIRNPLTIIKSATEIVTDEVEPEGNANTAITLIREEVDRMDRIISDLLNFARPKQANLVKEDLNSLIRHWLPPIVEELEKEGIQLVPQFDKFGEVFVDPDQLYQIFLNVIWNARDALSGHPNPHLFIRTEELDFRYACLHIQDTGPGMIPETLKQISEPFFTTKTRGTGLGLAVSQQLIDGMKGRMKIESEVEVGTTVSILLRLANAPFTRINPSDSGYLPLYNPEAGPFRPSVSTPPR